MHKEAQVIEYIKIFVIIMQISHAIQAAFYFIFVYNNIVLLPNIDTLAKYGGLDGG